MTEPMTARDKLKAAAFTVAAFAFLWGAGVLGVHWLVLYVPLAAYGLWQLHKDDEREQHSTPYKTTSVNKN